jgi:hypothetical protein
MGMQEMLSRHAGRMSHPAALSFTDAAMLGTLSQRELTA